jgi:hypothetical protein
MSKINRTIIEVHGHSIAIQNRDKQDYISLTDIARFRNSQEPFAIINNWMPSRSTTEFIGPWEKLCNPDFKPLEFERFKMRPAATTLFFRHSVGLRALKPLGSTRSQAATAAPLRTGTSPLSSPHGFHPSSSST